MRAAPLGRAHTNALELQEDRGMKRTIVIASMMCLLAPAAMALDAYPRTTIVELYTSTT